MAHGQNAARHRNREYWSRRPCANWSWGKPAKDICHRLERRMHDVTLARELRDLDAD